MCIFCIFKYFVATRYSALTNNYVMIIMILIRKTIRIRIVIVIIKLITMIIKTIEVMINNNNINNSYDNVIELI